MLKGIFCLWPGDSIIHALLYLTQSDPSFEEKCAERWTKCIFVQIPRTLSLKNTGSLKSQVKSPRNQVSPVMFSFTSPDSLLRRLLAGSMLRLSFVKSSPRSAIITNLMSQWNRSAAVERSTTREIRVSLSHLEAAKLLEPWMEDALPLKREELKNKTSHSSCQIWQWLKKGRGKKSTVLLLKKETKLKTSVHACSDTCCHESDATIVAT